MKHTTIQIDRPDPFAPKSKTMYRLVKAVENKLSDESSTWDVVVRSSADEGIVFSMSNQQAAHELAKHIADSWDNHLIMGIDSL